MDTRSLLSRVRNRLLGRERNARSDGAVLMRELMAWEPWCVDAFHLTDDGLTISGWAIPPAGRPEAVGFTLNGEPFDQVSFPRSRPDLRTIFWYCDAPELTGFACTAAVPRERLFASGKATVEYVRLDDGTPVHAGHHYCILDPKLDRAPFPDGARRARVHGSDSESAFRLEGYSSFIKLQEALARATGQGFREGLRVLDWGVGCARVGRYFAGVPRIDYCGVDIDADNVAWCSDHLGFGTYRHIPMMPPTPLPASSFDVLIGVSVFTHLREQAHLAWLEELRRLAAPGAVLLMTTHGPSTVCRSGQSVGMVRDWLARGFVDAGRNADLDGAVADNEYYRNTFHTHDYIREHWSRYFEIADIIPGYIGNHQDLVVMRRS